MKQLLYHAAKRLLLTVCLIASPVTLFAQSDFVVEPDQGIAFQQVDFLFPDAMLPNSDWGRVEIALAELAAEAGFSSGYLNVYTDAGWVVLNLPIEPSEDAEDLPDTVVTYFDLGVSPPDDINTLSAYAVFSADAPLTFSDGPRSLFAVGNAGWNAQGAGLGSVSVIPAAPAANLVFPGPSPAAPDMKIEQPKKSNIQAARNQCVPAAVANSLDYLERRYGIDVPNDHKKGLRGDNTLVGMLDSLMNRTAPSRTDTLAEGLIMDSMFTGKFRYLSKNKLGDKLINRHQSSGVVGAQGDYSGSGITSKSEGSKVTWSWLVDQIKNGEDVEMVWVYYDSNGRPTSAHMVRVIGVETKNGRNRLRYLHDRLQTDVDLKDSKGLETPWVDISDLDGDGTLNFGATNLEIEFAASESVLACELVGQIGSSTSTGSNNQGIRVRFTASAGVKTIRVVTAKNANCQLRSNGQALPANFNCTDPKNRTTQAEVDCRRVDNSKPATVVLEMEDCAGNKRRCDPVLATLSAEVPEQFALDQNYPNPFSSSTTIPFALAEPSRVTLKVYDLMGREVVTLVEADLPAGTYTVLWEGLNAEGAPMATGTYVYRLTTGTHLLSKTMTLLQ